MLRTTCTLETPTRRRCQTSRALTGFIRLLAVASLVGLAVFTGCSGALPAVKPPRIDTAAAAEGAITEFDTDGNGSVSKDEACEGIRSLWARYDFDDDGSITAEEFATRFEKWTGGDTGMMNLRVQLTYRGQPMPDANITMTPYAFLGDQVLASEGITDPYGYAFMAVPKENLPATQQTNFGMQVGLFKVAITHPQVDIPAKYNDETELSVDLSPSEANTGVAFKLK